MTSPSAVEQELRTDQPAAASLGANAFAVTAARLLVPALNLVLVVGIARLGGVESLGRYTVLVTLFLILENVALSQNQQREQGLNVTMKIATYFRES